MASMYNHSMSLPNTLRHLRVPSRRQREVLKVPVGLSSDGESERISSDIDSLQRETDEQSTVSSTIHVSVSEQNVVANTDPQSGHSAFQEKKNDNRAVLPFFGPPNLRDCSRQELHSIKAEKDAAEQQSWWENNKLEDSDALGKALQTIPLDEEAILEEDRTWELYFDKHFKHYRMEYEDFDYMNILMWNLQEPMPSTGVRGKLSPYASNENKRLQRANIVKRLLACLFWATIEKRHFPIVPLVKLIQGRVESALRTPKYFNSRLEQTENPLLISCEIACVAGFDERCEIASPGTKTVLTFTKVAERLFRRGMFKPSLEGFREAAKLICLAGFFISPSPSRVLQAHDFISKIPTEVLADLRLGDVLCPNRSLPNNVHWDPEEPVSRASRKHEKLECVELEAGNTLSRRDLQLSYLQRIGKLAIRWSDDLDDHLALRPEGEDEVLSVFWPGNTVYHALDNVCQRCWTCVRCYNSNIDGSTSIEELAKTYRLIFQSSNKLSLNLKEHQKLNAPNWLKATEFQSMGLRFWKRDVELKDLPEDLWKGDTQMQLEGIKGLDTAVPAQVSYLQFPSTAQRLKTLKEYMDKQKPSGLKGLWFDRRNMHAWWTFWVAIFVGAVTIPLLVASTALAGVQTRYGIEGVQLQEHPLQPLPPA